MVSTTCDHLFCANCWKKYIATAIKDCVGCLTLRCPEPGCKAAAGADMVDMLASKGDKEKYYTYLHRSYVELNRKRKWCPSPGWRCATESHRPAECKTVAEWMEKSSSEVENTNWILTYTKPCPKCSVVIDQG